MLRWDCFYFLGQIGLEAITLFVKLPSRTILFLVAIITYRRSYKTVGSSPY